MKPARALGIAFLSWLVPFAASCVLFPLKGAYAPLFDTLMGAVLTGTGVLLGLKALPWSAPGSLSAALGLGLLWWGVNVGFDLLMFSWGPMKMPVLDYLRDIGLAYVQYPIILAGLQLARGRRPGGG
jgi:hypothetical protein